MNSIETKNGIKVFVIKASDGKIPKHAKRFSQLHEDEVEQIVKPAKWDEANERYLGYDYRGQYYYGCGFAGVGGFFKESLWTACRSLISDFDAE